MIRARTRLPVRLGVGGTLVAVGLTLGWLLSSKPTAPTVREGPTSDLTKTVARSTGPAPAVVSHPLVASAPVQVPRQAPMVATDHFASIPAQIAERAQSDLDGALAWLAQQGNEEERQNWIALALIEASRHLPQLAASRMAFLRDETLRLEVMDKVVGEWAALDFISALEWANGQSDPIERSASLGAAFRSSSDSDPALTLRAAEAMMGQSYDFHRLAFTVLHTWTQTAPRDALTWAATRLDQPLRQQAFASFLSTWAESAPDQATAWVLSLSESQGKEDALAALGAGGS